MSTTGPVHRIAEGEPNGQPVFPCWLWKSKPLVGTEPLWLRFESLKDGPSYADTLEKLLECGGYTHWCPDQPDAPAHP